ncbi:MAG: FtsX-like permease family protein [Eubacteriaceae bacterium]|nr:FtsX-like permease family protein [Eubacteriaceae bacterium]
MSVLDKLTYRTLKDRKARTIVTVLGIFLAAMLLSGVVTFASTLQNYLIGSEEEYSGSWYSAVFDADEREIKAADADPAAGEISVLHTVGYVKLSQSTNDYKPYIYIAEAGKGFFKQMNVKLQQGRLPKTANEIVLSSHMSSDGGVKLRVGDKISLAVGRRVSSKGKPLYQNQGYETGEKTTDVTTKKYTVTGIIERSAAEPYQAPGYTAFAGEGSTEAAEYPVTAYIKTSSAAGIRSYTEKYFGEKAQVEYNEELLSITGDSEDNSFQNVLLATVAILFALIMMGAIALIYNAFSISVKDRIRQLGMLSSIGATGRQIKEITLKEGASICLMGIPAGLLAGVGAIGALLYILKGKFRNIAGDDINTQIVLHINFIWLLAAGITAMIAVMISIYIPAVKAGRAGAIDAVKQASVYKDGGKYRTEKPAGPGKLLGFAGMMARKYFRRDRKKYRAPIVSLFLSIVLFVTASTFTGLIKTSFHSPKEDYDVMYSSYVSDGQPDVDTDIQNYLKMQSGEAITDMSFVETIDCTGEIPVSELSDRAAKICRNNNIIEGGKANPDIQIYIVDNHSFNKYIKKIGAKKEDVIGSKTSQIYDESRYTGTDTMMTDMIGSGTEKRISMTDGTKKKVRVAFRTNELPWSCSDGEDMTFLVMSANTASKVFGNYEKYTGSRNMAFRSSMPRATYNSLERICRDVGMNTEGLYNKSSERKSYRSMILVIEIFSYGFIILISLIAAANVVNTISTNVMMRRRDLVMLRAMGMDGKSMRRMANIECLLYGIKSLIFGIPAAILLSWLMFKVWPVPDFWAVFPWKGIIISVFSVFAVVFAAMMYATRKIEKSEYTVEILRGDNI